MIKTSLVHITQVSRLGILINVQVYFLPNDWYGYNKQGTIIRSG